MVVKAWMKVLMCSMLSFMILFSTVGYAALSTDLGIDGYAEFKVTPGIYITDVRVSGTPSYATATSVGYLEHTTTQNSSFRRTNNRYAGTITYQIEVWNNTDYQYAYVGLSYNSSESGYNGNAYIGRNNYINIVTKDSPTDSSATFNTNDYLEPGERRTFYATYTLGTSLSRNTTYSTLVNYRFGKYVDSQDDAADAILVKFGEILNDTSAGGGYQTLISKIDDKYDGTSWKANFIGNVVGAHNADTETMNALFGEDNMNMTIDGKQSNITVLIKRENLDNNENTGDDYTARYGNSTTSGNGCEMTIYMTSESLTTSGARPTVYAAVFTCENNNGTLGPWKMVGDIYKGDALVVGYTGNTSSTNSGSFSTDDWFAHAGTYTIEAGSGSYSYTVANDATIESILQVKSDAAFKTVLDNLITEAVEASTHSDIAGPVLIDLNVEIAKAQEFVDTYVQGTTLRASVIPVVKSLNKALQKYNDALASASE